MITVFEDHFPLKRTFTIARGSKNEAAVLRVAITRDGLTGQGECVPYARYGETLETVRAQIEGLDPAIDRIALQDALPAGAARNAVDCALWDLEAKAAGKRIWELIGMPPPVGARTVYTLSLEEPDAMRAQAELNAARPFLKVKLGNDGDLERIEAVRQGAPRAGIVVDANEGWSEADYARLAPAFLRLGVTMVEQPFPADADEALAGMERPLPVCADESCHDRASLAGLAGKYDMVNIKLDKTGGLTEALALRSAALEAGFEVMVGCMVGSSLAMAPALMLAPGARVVDLDGPLLLAEDRAPPLSFQGAEIGLPAPGLWG